MIFFLLSCLLNQQPAYVLNANDEVDEFHRVLDVTTLDGKIVTLDKDDFYLRELTLEGEIVKTFAGPGEGPGEIGGARSVINFKGSLYVTVAETRSVSIFTNGEFKKRIKLDSIPGSIVAFSDCVVVASMSLNYPFYVIKNEELDSRFMVDSYDWAGVPEKSQQLWLGGRAVKWKDKLVAGLIWRGMLASIDFDSQGKKSSGKVLDVWNGESHLFPHPRKFRGQIGFEYFASLGHTVGPDGMVWLSASEEGKSRACNRLIRVDMEKQKVLSQVNLTDHIRQVRYFDSLGLMALVRGDDRVELYKPEVFIK